eukprot:COSAG02_NODE_721_length_18054_cov_3.613422_10_plen_880_part_00
MEDLHGGPHGGPSTKDPGEPAQPTPPAQANVRRASGVEEGTPPLARAEAAGVVLERSLADADDVVTQLRAQVEQLQAENQDMARRLQAGPLPRRQDHGYNSGLAELGLATLVLRVLSLGVTPSVIDEALDGRDYEAKAILLALIDGPASASPAQSGSPVLSISPKRRIHASVMFKVCHPDSQILEDGALVRNSADIERPSTAICKDAIMAIDRQELAYADFKMVECSSNIVVGVVRPDFEYTICGNAAETKDGWGLCVRSGCLLHNGHRTRNHLHRVSADAGESIGLLLDMQQGRLTAFKHDKRVCTVASNLDGALCWMATLFSKDDTVRITAASPQRLEEIVAIDTAGREAERVLLEEALVDLSPQGRHTVVQHVSSLGDLQAMTTQVLPQVSWPTLIDDDVRKLRSVVDMTNLTTDFARHFDARSGSSCLPTSSKIGPGSLFIMDGRVGELMSVSEVDREVTGRQISGERCWKLAVVTAIANPVQLTVRFEVGGDSDQAIGLLRTAAGGEVRDYRELKNNGWGIKQGLRGPVHQAGAQIAVQSDSDWQLKGRTITMYYEPHKRKVSFWSGDSMSGDPRTVITGLPDESLSPTVGLYCNRATVVSYSSSETRVEWQDDGTTSVGVDLSDVHVLERWDGELSAEGIATLADAGCSSVEAVRSLDADVTYALRLSPEDAIELAKLNSHFAAIEVVRASARAQGEKGRSLTAACDFDGAREEFDGALQMETYDVDLTSILQAGQQANDAAMNQWLSEQMAEMSDAGRELVLSRIRSLSDFRSFSTRFRSEWLDLDPSGAEPDTEVVDPERAMHGGLCQKDRVALNVSLLTASLEAARSRPITSSTQEDSSEQNPTSMNGTYSEDFEQRVASQQMRQGTSQH